MHLHQLRPPKHLHYQQKGPFRPLCPRTGLRNPLSRVSELLIQRRFRLFKAERVNNHTWVLTAHRHRLAMRALSNPNNLRSLKGFGPPVPRHRLKKHQRRAYRRSR